LTCSMRSTIALSCAFELSPMVVMIAPANQLMMIAHKPNTQAQKV
jgi:hypothetical protein